MLMIKYKKIVKTNEFRIFLDFNTKTIKKVPNLEIFSVAVHCIFDFHLKYDQNTYKYFQQNLCVFGLRSSGV